MRINISYGIVERSPAQQPSQPFDGVSRMSTRERVEESVPLPLPSAGLLVAKSQRGYRTYRGEVLENTQQKIF